MLDFTAALFFSALFSCSFSVICARIEQIGTCRGFTEWHDGSAMLCLRELFRDVRGKVWRLEAEVATQSSEGEVVALREKAENKNVEIA